MKNTHAAFTHVTSVVDFALRITKAFPEVDPDLITVAVWWHDVGRFYHEDHERISAEMAYNSLRILNVEIDLCQQAFDAIVFHKWSMHPQTLEGEIIRDADKLDFFSPSRWKFWVADNELNVLEDLTDLLPTFRNDCLHLEISKTLFDQVLINLTDYIQSVSTPGFSKIKNKLVTYSL